jgi:hypothetical protein
MVGRTARDFFEVNVDPSYNAWRENPADLWRAYAAVHFAAAQADWYIKEAMPSVDFGAACEDLYRRCPQLQLLRILDNSTKHMIHNGGSTAAAKVTAAPTLDEVEDFDALDDFDNGITVLIKHLDTGAASQPLRPQLEAVVEFWRATLR